MSSDNKRINTSTAAAVLTKLFADINKVDVPQVLISMAAPVGVYLIWFDFSVKSFQTAYNLTDLWGAALFDEDDEEDEDEDDEEKN